MVDNGDSIAATSAPTPGRSGPNRSWAGGDDMRRRIDAFDWATTPLGAAGLWPASLRTLVDLLLNASQPMFLAWGPERTWIYNDAFVPILGRKHPAALGRQSMELWQEAWVDLEPLFGRVFAGEPVRTQNFSVEIDRGDGVEQAVFDFSYTPVHDETGGVAGLFGVCAETSARVLAEHRAAVEASDLRQGLLVSLADAFRDLADPDELSFAAAELLGRSFNVSRAGYGTIHKGDETITIERDWNMPGVQSIAGMLRFRDHGSYIEDLKRGVTVVVADAEKDPRTVEKAAALKAISAQSFVNMPVTEHGGLVALLYLNHAEAREWTVAELSVIREVAERTRVAVERRRAELELRELAASLERQVAERTQERDRVWRNSRDLLVVVDADGIFRAVNPAWTSILGHSADDVAGRRFTDFIVPEDLELTRRTFEQASLDGTLADLENRYIHQDGTHRWISWHAAVEGDSIYGYGRDVTESKLAEARLANAQDALRQAQKMEAVGQLTGGIAHDFNNLLQGISVSLQVLEARLKIGKTDGAERYIGMGQHSVRRAAALTQRLLAFSRRQTLDPKPTDVNRLVGGMEELIRRTVGPAVELEVIGAGGLWATCIDASQLENSLLNLCINARDAMPDGGRLTIETANKWLDERAARDRELAPGQYISLCVTDNGTGMSPEIVARVFDPFFTTKPIGQGTGLGLSMVYGFVRQSGGQVRIYSEPGQGTTMCLYLPRHAAGATDEETGAAPDISERGDGETVLVIEDEDIVRELIAEILEDAGYTVLTAEDGPSGLRTFQAARRVDLLVTDVGLPGGLNGRQVADAARVIEPALKVLFITGYAENAAVGNGHLERGMEVITKPFEVTALINKVGDMLERRAG